SENSPSPKRPHPERSHRICRRRDRARSRCPSAFPLRLSPNWTDIIGQLTGWAVVLLLACAAALALRTENRTALAQLPQKALFLTAATLSVGRRAVQV